MAIIFSLLSMKTNVQYPMKSPSFCSAGAIPATKMNQPADTARQAMVSHDAVRRNVCGIPNSEAGKFMYVLKRSFQQGVIQYVYISCYMA